MKTIGSAIAVCMIVVMLTGCATTPSYAYSSTAIATGTITYDDWALINFTGSSDLSSAVTNPNFKYNSSSDGISFTDSNHLISSGYSYSLTSSLGDNESYSYRLSISIQGVDSRITNCVIKCSTYSVNEIDEDNPSDQNPLTLIETVTVSIGADGSGIGYGTATYSSKISYPITMTIDSDARLSVPEGSSDREERYDIGDITFRAHTAGSSGEDSCKSSWIFNNNVIAVSEKTVSIENGSTAEEVMKDQNGDNPTNNRDDGIDYNFVDTTKDGQKYPSTAITVHDGSDGNINVADNQTQFNLQFTVPDGEWFYVKIVYNQKTVALPNIINVEISGVGSISLNTLFNAGTHTAYLVAERAADTQSLAQQGSAPTSKDSFIRSDGGINITISGYKGNTGFNIFGGAKDSDLTFEIFFYKE